MAYVHPNFKSKKALKDAIKDGRKVEVFQPNNIFNREFHPNDRGIAVEGPHYPEPHKWYAMVDLDDEGYVCKVR